MMWPLKWKLSACSYWGAIYFSKFHKMKFGNLVEICFWLNLAMKGLMKVTFQLILGLKRKFKRFKEKSEHISVEKRSCYAPSQVYKFGLYRYCKSPFLMITKRKKKTIYLRGLKIFRTLYLQNAVLFFLKDFSKVKTTLLTHREGF